MAQYRTCFSIANQAEPPPEGTAANKASLLRKCDAGVVFSEMTNLADTTLSFPGEASPRYLQRMIVKAPQVSLASGEVSLEVKALVESLGQRSFAAPDVNCTISFRQTCSDFAPNMGRLYCPFYQAAALMRGLQTRYAFQVVSWPTRGSVFIVGGSTVGNRHTRDVLVSGFAGMNYWSEMPYNDAVPWFIERSNQTVIVFRDILTVMAGYTTRTIETATGLRDETTFYNDVWVYAHHDGVQNTYLRPGQPSPTLSRDQDFQPFWIKVTEAAPWMAREGMSAVEHRGYLYILGGDGESGPVADLWRTWDLKEWTKLQDLQSPDLPTPMWQGRNSVFVLSFQGSLYVIARVQQSHYNTFVSDNGVDWRAVEGACALANVEVQAAVTYRDRMLLFTVGCHDYEINVGEPRFDKAVPCSNAGGDGDFIPAPFHRENRIYYSSNGVTWRLSQRPFRLNQFLVPRFVPHEWSGSLVGEFRFGYRVLVHEDTMYLYGGEKRIIFRDTVSGAPLLSRDGNMQLLTVQTFHLWMSKGLIDMQQMCVETSDLTKFQIKERMTATEESECRFFFTSLPGSALRDAVLA